MTINAPSNQTVGQSLTLESSITTVRGITSRVDIVWSSNGEELRRIQEVNKSLTSNYTELFEDNYNIPLLSTTDYDRVIQCKVVIMTNPSKTAVDSVTLDIAGKW